MPAEDKVTFGFDNVPKPEPILLHVNQGQLAEILDNVIEAILSGQHIRSEVVRRLYDDHEKLRQHGHCRGTPDFTKCPPES